MNETTHRVCGDEAEQPGNNEYYGECVEHGVMEFKFGTMVELGACLRDSGFVFLETADGLRNRVASSNIPRDVQILTNPALF